MLAFTFSKCDVWPLNRVQWLPWKWQTKFWHFQMNLADQHFACLLLLFTPSHRSLCVRDNKLLRELSCRAPTEHQIVQPNLFSFLGHFQQQQQSTTWRTSHVQTLKKSNYSWSPSVRQHCQPHTLSLHDSVSSCTGDSDDDDRRFTLTLQPLRPLQRPHRRHLRWQTAVKSVFWCLALVPCGVDSRVSVWR